MISPPSSVMIAGQRIRIRIDDELESWGEYHSDERLILLSRKTIKKRSTYIETLRHEMLHASIDLCGLSHLKNFEEEALIRCLDNCFFPAWSRLKF